MTNKTPAQLRRLRLGVRATLALALAVSLAANVLHAADDPISRAISAWPPVALMLAAELISRIPAASRLMSVTRIAATVVIAAIAAWVSYWHMVAVAKHYGESGYGAQYLWPLTVDGLAIVASICLVEIGGRISALNEPVADGTAAEPARSEPVAEPEPDQDEPRELSRLDARLDEPLTHTDPWLRAEPVPAEPEPSRLMILSPHREPNAPLALKLSTGRRSSAELVVQAHSAEPNATNQRIAELAGVSLATVKRHRPARTINGSRAS